MLMTQKKKRDMNKRERTERLPCEYKTFRCLRCTAITEYCWEWLHKCNNYPHTVKEEKGVRMRYNMWVDFVVSSLPQRLREVFLWVLRFSPLLKNQHFQIPIRPGMVDEQPLHGSATFKPSFVNLYVKFEF